MFTLKQLLKTLYCDYITICYAGFGERIYKGLIKEIPQSILSHYSSFYVSCVLPQDNGVYVEVHENKNFLEE